MNERILFFGRNKGYGVTLRCFGALLNHIRSTNHQIVMTVVTEDHPDDKGTLAAMADAARVPWRCVPGNDVNHPAFLRELALLQPTLCLTVQFPKIFGKPLRRVAGRACLNLHRGWPLRGGSIDERAIFYQITHYYLILHHMEDRIDAGKIIGKAGFPLRDDEDGYSLVAKADEAGENTLRASLLPHLGNVIPKGDVQRFDPNAYGAKGSLSHLLDWGKPAETIQRLSRAFHHPRKSGASLQVRRQTLYLTQPARVLTSRGSASPGTLLQMRPSETVFATATRPLAIGACHLGDFRPFSLASYLQKQGLCEGDRLDS